MRATIGLILVLVAFVAAWQIGGCISPPAGTVWLDTTGDGRIDALVLADDDGKPIIDTATGGYLIVPNSQVVRAVDAGDDVLSTILLAAGAVLGVPVLVGVGSVWKGARVGRLLLNLVLSVQSARKALADRNLDEALKLLDQALDAEQTDAVKELVERLKQANDVESVTDG